MEAKVISNKMMSANFYVYLKFRYVAIPISLEHLWLDRRLDEAVVVMF